MEEIINKPDSQFKDILNDLIDYSKDSEEKSALIKEVCLARHPTKPAASLNSSIYSSAASSSSSTSSASDSSTNSASSSSTSSTLSSPSQSNQGDREADNSRGSNSSHDIDNIEVAKMEDLGKTARILEHRLAITNEFKTAETGVGKVAVTASHSHNRSISLYSKSPLPSSSANLSQSMTHDSAQQTSSTHVNSTIDPNATPWGPEPWKTISGKRDKRRKKPVEHPVLSQHIPGHKGEQDVEWLVKFIESGPPGPSNVSSSSSKKVSKNTKPQSKRLPSQTMERERENLQRRPINKNTTTHIRPLQQVSSSDQTNTSTQLQSAIQRKGQTISNDSLTQQSEPQKTAHEPAIDRKTECKEFKLERTHDPRCEKGSRQDEAAVTFADHICINDDEANSNGKYIFGFFDEQQPRTNKQAKNIKQAAKLNEDPQNSSKPKRVSQKHKLKHPKASLNSEQKRYKFNDNIDANSFNYHQILEFISNSWESTAKSRLQIVKQAGSL